MFVTFEGMDGSGKTTQVRQTAAYLRGLGFDVLLTREPGGTLIGDQVRAVLLKQASTGEDNLPRTQMHPHTELLLFCASRAQLVAEVIHPHLQRGGLVISDRYIDSTFAYQGYGHGLDLKALRQVIHFATGGLMPDLTIYLDIPPAESLKRRAAASLFGEEWNRLDEMEIAFHQRVYAGYKALLKKDPKRWLRVDARESIEHVQAQIVAALQQRLNR